MIGNTAELTLPTTARPDTYVLRSLLAEVIVERARQLTRFAGSEDALVGERDALDWSAAAFEPEIVALFGSAKTAEAVARDLNRWVGPSPWPVAGFIGSAPARSRLVEQLLSAPAFAKTWSEEVRAFEAAMAPQATTVNKRHIAHARQVALSAVELASVGRRNASLARSQLRAQEREVRRWAVETDRRSAVLADHQRDRFAADCRPRWRGEDWAAVDAGHTAMLGWMEWRQRRAEATHVGLLDLAEQVTSAAAKAAREAERARLEYERLLGHQGEPEGAGRWPWQGADGLAGREEVAAALRLHGALLALLPWPVRRRLLRGVTSRLAGNTDRPGTEALSARTLFIAVPCLCTTPQHLSALRRTPEPLNPGWLFVEESRKPVRSEEMILRRHAKRVVTLSSDGDVVAVDDRVA